MSAVRVLTCGRTERQERDRDGQRSRQQEFPFISQLGSRRRSFEAFIEQDKHSDREKVLQGTEFCTSTRDEDRQRQT
ncbi:hypothetical protein JOB18_025945 [Solea senegalensis]|uniref:Uncharacterized protein n=1 Tax=Solea senegalensis TaxID=28829 RepID=A0AAV6SB10_SOLSE|nr:hypothetical protein JOB18_025945 [Solea senegalensis]